MREQFLIPCRFLPANKGAVEAQRGIAYDFILPHRLEVLT